MGYISVYGVYREDGELILDDELRAYDEERALDAVKMRQSIPDYVTIFYEEYEQGELVSAYRWDRTERGNWKPSTP